jgi:hypothetical protein
MLDIALVYQLVGLCHVHGIVDGEFVEDLTAAEICKFRENRHPAFLGPVV